MQMELPFLRSRGRASADGSPFLDIAEADSGRCHPEECFLRPARTGAPQNSPVRERRLESPRELPMPERLVACPPCVSREVPDRTSPAATTRTAVNLLVRSKALQTYTELGGRGSNDEGC